MIELSIPGYGKLKLEHLVSDYNGTLACDGIPVPGVKEILRELAERVEVHVVTADTFFSVRRELAGLPCKITIIRPDSQTEAKSLYVRKLGLKNTVAFGNGKNDNLMIKEVALGIAVIQGEGAAVETLQASDIVIGDICSALRLLLVPDRIIATLRC